MFLDTMVLRNRWSVRTWADEATTGLMRDRAHATFSEDVEMLEHRQRALLVADMAAAEQGIGDLWTSW